ncbi:MAG: GNAT family N-acetyltransferase [Deltaproteobacteria bacterium]
MISPRMLEAAASPFTASGMRVEVVSTRPRWMELRGAWGALVDGAAQPTPMMTHEWFTAFLDNFAPEKRLHVVMAFRGAEPVGGAPLVWEHRWFHGIPHTVLTSLSNEHSQRFDVLAEGPEVVELMWAHLSSLPGWDLLELKDVPAGGSAEGFTTMANHEGWDIGRWESMRTPYVPLASPLVIGSKLRQNLRRRRRKLEEVGPVQLVENEGGPGLDELLEEGLALEAAGWKGEAGTAISCQPATRGFYRELARAAASRGWLALHGLRAGERLVAFQFGLRHSGRYFLPKPAYDEELGACSPGQLLMEEMLQRCRERGLSEFDFLGPSMPWKRDWTELERPHSWQLVFRRSAAGRALRFAKLELAPKARAFASQWKEKLTWKRS